MTDIRGTTTMSDTERISIRLPKDMVEMVDFLVEVNDFPTRSEAIRQAVRDLIYERVCEMDMASKVRKMEEAKHAYLEIKALKEEYLKQ